MLSTYAESVSLNSIKQKDIHNHLQNNPARKRVKGLLQHNYLMSFVPEADI